MYRRLAAVGVLALGLLLFCGSPSADAHALLQSSDPPAGAQLDTAPTAIVLAFTEPSDLSLSVVHVLDSEGTAVERGRVAAVAGQRNSLVLALPALERGSYTVTWRTTSSVDGHTTAGAFAFGVQVPPNATATATAPKTPSPSATSVGARWALYLGLAAIVGAARFRSATRRKLLVAWLAAAVGAVGLVLELLRTSHSGVADLLSSTTGTKLAVELAAVAVVGLTIAVVPRFAGVAAAAAMLARVWGGHAAASTVPWFTIGIQWVHLVAVGVWIGGLPWLVMALRRAGPGNRGLIARRFSRVATVALAVTIITGSARALSEVGSWRALFDTSFGTALLIKLAVVAAVIALGAVSRFRNAPIPVLGAEALAGIAVLAVTAVLTGLPPAASVTKAAVTTHVVATGHDFGTTVRVRLEVTPGTAGPNQFSLRATDYDSGRAVVASGVSLRLAPADRSDIPATTIALRRVGDRWEAASAAVAVPGRWRVTAIVEKDAGGTEVPLAFTTRQPPQRVTAQRNSGLPTIYTITIGARSVQTYIDPGKRGANEVHFTFLDGAGQEAATDVIEIAARRAEGGSRPLDFRRLGPGHFVADAQLDTGAWRFTARTKDGLEPSFTQSIR